METEPPTYPEIISSIKEKMNIIMMRPAMWVGYDADALAGLMYGYIDCLNMARHGYRYQSHHAPRGEHPRVNKHKTWEQNVAEIKRIVEKHLNDDRSEPEEIPTHICSSCLGLSYGGTTSPPKRAPGPSWGIEDAS